MMYPSKEVLDTEPVGQTRAICFSMVLDIFI